MNLSLDSNVITLFRHVYTSQKNRAGHNKHQCLNAANDLAQILYFIQTAAKIIRKACGALTGDAGKTNIQGEVVKKLDVFANETFINMLKSSFATCILVSEENENIIEVETERQGKYIVCFDPLDGSANVDSFISVGTIFAIFKKGDNEKLCVKQALQPGKNVVAAGYILYSSATVMVISLGYGVDEFILDTTIGEFLLRQENIKIPAKGNTYSVNESYEPRWEEPIKEYIISLKEPNNSKPYTARYIGSMVADMHRILKFGGIFLYPATSDVPSGKLRLLYECIPMAFLITQAGGLASNGTGPILDIVPQTIHQRSPIFIGSKEDVENLLSLINK